MKSNDENMKSIMAFQGFRDSRRVEEGQYPSLLIPWIFADVIYLGTGVKTKPINHTKIRYEEDGLGIRLTIEDLASGFDYFAYFRTYYQNIECLMSSFEVEKSRFAENGLAPVQLIVASGDIANGSNNEDTFPEICS